jgi:hypothetical protein
MIYDSLTQRLYDGRVGLDVVIYGHRRRYLARRDMPGTGSFRRQYEATEPFIRTLVRRYGSYRALPWANDAGERVNLVETG